MNFFPQTMCHFRDKIQRWIGTQKSNISRFESGSYVMSEENLVRSSNTLVLIALYRRRIRFADIDAEPFE
jgi:hypothetical protein